jgi:hypothetical protein
MELTSSQIVIGLVAVGTVFVVVTGLALVSGSTGAVARTRRWSARVTGGNKRGARRGRDGLSDPSPAAAGLAPQR